MKGGRNSYWAVHFYWAARLDNTFLITIFKDPGMIPDILETYCCSGGCCGSCCCVK